MWTSRGLGPYRRLDLALAVLASGLLAVSLARRWPVGARVAVLVVAGQYALSLPVLGSAIDVAAPLVAGALVLACELSDVVTETAPAPFEAPGMRERRWARLAAIVGGAVAVSTAVLALAGAGAGSDAVWQVAGVTALAALAASLAALLRTART